MSLEHKSALYLPSVHVPSIESLTERLNVVNVEQIVGHVKDLIRTWRALVDLGRPWCEP